MTVAVQGLPAGPGHPARSDSQQWPQGPGLQRSTRIFPQLLRPPVRFQPGKLPGAILHVHSFVAIGRR